MNQTDATGYLTHTGFFVPIVTLQRRLGNAGYANIQKRLTKISVQKVGPPKIAKMYLEFDLTPKLRCVYLPRWIGLGLIGKVLHSVDILFKPIVQRECKLAIDLYENQVILCRHLMKYVYTPERIANGRATCILNLRAGMGKTFVASGLFNALGMRSLYVVPTRPLALQAVKDLKVCMDPSVVIGLFGKAKKNKPDPSTVIANQYITVIVINSAIKQSDAFFSGYSLVILDEVHMYCTDQRRSIFRLSSHCVLGMSATTEDRDDGFDVIAHKELGEIIRADKVPGFTYEDVEFDGTARIISYNGPPEFTQNLIHESTQRVFTHYMHNQFIADPQRTQVVVDELIRLYDWRDSNGNKHHIYVFAEEVEILRTARTAFAAALKHRADIVADIVAPELIDGEENVEENKDDKNTDLGEGLEMFTGGLKDEKINEIILKGRVLFATFGFAATGTSILKMSAMIFLTPRKANMKQCVARILRRGSNIEIPRIVVDVVDNKTALRYQVGKRMLAYDFYGFKRENIKIKA